MTKKTLFTLNVDGYSPQITSQTYPFLKRYADKIGASFQVITKRKFPDFPVTYEKFQIYELGKGSDWIIYIDSDALVHPDTFDITELLSKDTVMTCGKDFAPIRWSYDNNFRRHGQHVGAGNWFTVASSWCLDLWKPLDDLSLEEALDNIHPTNDELLMGITPEHLIDDYVISRNIAKFGLKFKSFKQLLEEQKNPGEFLWHEYLLTEQEKIQAMKVIIKQWEQSPQERDAQRR